MTLVYLVYLDGLVKVDYSLDVKPGLPNIPKVGFQGAIPREYDNIAWYGRGPMENYCDRRSAADVGIYDLNLKEFMEPYVVPQENGNRMNIRWMYLSNTATKNGLLIVADSLLSMSAWPYTEKNIQSARHTIDLIDAGFLTLNIDLAQMGVGGNDSWSDVAAPLEQYQLKSQPYHYAFYIAPFNSKKISPSAKAKEILSR